MEKKRRHNQKPTFIYILFSSLNQRHFMSWKEREKERTSDCLYKTCLKEQTIDTKYKNIN